MIKLYNWYDDMFGQLVALLVRYLLLAWVAVYGLAIELSSYQSTMRCIMLVVG